MFQQGIVSFKQLLVIHCHTHDPGADHFQWEVFTILALQMIFDPGFVGFIEKRLVGLLR